MTKEERWKAAIEEMKPLLETLKGIRDKYDLSCVEIRARNFFDKTGKYSVITADDDCKAAEVGEVYALSWRDFEDDSLSNDFSEWTKQEDSEEQEDNEEQEDSEDE